jgi:hypothetical protein
MSIAPTPQNSPESFINLFESLNALEFALLRERVLVIMSHTVKQIENDPTKFNNKIVHPDNYLGLAFKVQVHLGIE